jgi:hypothetical protein
MAKDKQLVAKSQPYEPASVFRMLKKRNEIINHEQVKEVIKLARSRAIIYTVLQKLGYETAKVKKLTSTQEKKVDEVFGKIKSDPKTSRQLMEAEL